MNILNTIGAFFERLRGGGRDPVRDWLAMITFSAVALAGIVVWNVWAFDTVASGGVIGAPAPATTPMFNNSSLDAIHSIFATRVAEEAKYLSGVYRYVDPSQ